MQDAVVRAAAVLTTNFNADMAAIVADHGVAVVSQVATVYADREWAVFCELDTFTQAQPGIGVYASGARTNARRQNEREWIVLVVAEYYARASDPAKLKVQARLAAEAILRSIDRMSEGLDVLARSQRRSSRSARSRRPNTAAAATSMASASKGSTNRTPSPNTAVRMPPRRARSNRWPIRSALTVFWPRSSRPRTPIRCPPRRPTASRSASAYGPP